MLVAMAAGKFVGVVKSNNLSASPSPNSGSRDGLQSTTDSLLKQLDNLKPLQSLESTAVGFQNQTYCSPDLRAIKLVWGQLTRQSLQLGESQELDKGWSIVVLPYCQWLPSTRPLQRASSYWMHWLMRAFTVEWDEIWAHDRPQSSRKPCLLWWLSTSTWFQRQLDTSRAIMRRNIGQAGGSAAAP